MAQTIRNRKNLIWLLFIAMCLIFSSSTCEEPIDLQIEDEKQLVVICEFSPENVFDVVVSESKSVLNTSDEVEYRRDAKVEIMGSGQASFGLDLTNDVVGGVPYYRSEVKPEIIRNYSLRVEVNDLPMIEAVSSIPEAIAVEGKIRDLEINPKEGDIYTYSADLIFEWEDKANEANYYHLNIYRPITFFWVLDGDTLTNVVDPLGAEQISENLNAEALFQINFNGGVLLKDETFDGSLVSLPIRLQFELDRSEELFELLYVELRTVSKDYYDFHAAVSLQQEDTRTTPLSEPVIIPTNIRGGLGVFAGYNLARDTLSTK
jgi:hypothetical protein